MRTITITDALLRVGQVVPSLENLRPELKYLADVRNGVVHAAQLSSEAQDRVLLPFVTACDLLLEDMDASRDAFWGEYVELVDTHRAQSTKAAELEAAEAITLARMAFAERFGELDEPTRKAILASIEEGYGPEKYEQGSFTTVRPVAPWLLFTEATMSNGSPIGRLATMVSRGARARRS